MQLKFNLFLKSLSCIFMLGIYSHADAQLTLPFNEGFENATAATYTTNQTPISGLTGTGYSWSYQFTTGTAGDCQTDACPRTGSRAISFGSGGGTVQNYLILEADLSLYVGVTDLDLSFWYEDYADETTNGGDAVWIRGSNTDPWVLVYQLDPQSLANGVWTQVTIDVDQELAAASQTVSSTFGVRFGQVDNATFLGCTTFNDGMSFDDISITGSSLLPDDAGISALNTPTLPVTPGVQPVQVELTNYGTNNLTSATVQWSAGGVAQTSAPFSGSLVQTATAPVNLGTYNFGTQPTVFKFWTTSPNGTTDTNNANDTLEVLVCAGLAGTFTCGLPTSDFPTFADAMFALYDCGVSGPVTINVEPGTYSGAINFNGQITGASATNRITFNGLGGTAGTILTHDGTGSNGNAVIAFDDVRYVTFQNFTIQNSGTTDCWGALFTNNARYCEVKNNYIEMLAGTGSIDVCGVLASASYADDFSEGQNAFYCVVEGNEIVGGERAITFEGANANRNVGNKIMNNYIHDVDDYGIYLDDQDSVEIIGNTINNLLSTFNYGIYTFDQMDFIIRENDVNALSYGIYISDGNFNLDGTPTRRGQIINNMVQVENTYALFLDDVEQTDIYHNTILHTGTASATLAAAYMNDMIDVNIKNNIFVSDACYTFRHVDATAFASMDYNLFYKTSSANTNFIQFGTTIYTDLADWQNNNTFGHGANSVSGDPIFYGPNDLHVDGYLANDAGDNSVGVTVDIDGETRPTAVATTVDIGADEFTPKNNDAGVVALLSPQPPLPTGFFPVTVEVRNFAVDTLTIFAVEWTYNGVQQSTTTYTGPPLPPQTNVTLNLGAINFPPGVDADYCFWTTQPNSVADERTSNDTLCTNQCQGIAGSYTVGTPNSDFPTIQSAIDAIYECGIGGNVFMNLEPGTYSGAQLQMVGRIPGADLNAQVYWDGADPALVTLTHDASGGDNATVLMDDVSFVNVQNMTIATTAISGGDGWGVHMINMAEYITIRNNVITATHTSSIFDVIPVVASASYTDDFTEGLNANHVTIEGNTITGGEMGIHLEGSFSLGNLLDINILNNNISGFDDYGIYLDQMDTIEISGNTIDATTGTATICRGIYAFDLQSFIIERNNITANDWGVYLSNGNGTGFLPRRGKVQNNFVYSNNDDAFYMISTRTTDIWHNTFVAGAAFTSGANGLYMTNQQDIDMRNNIFATYSSSTSAYCVQSASNTFMTAMDNNNFYKPNGTNIVRWGTTNFTNLADWQTNNGFGYGVNSLDLNPNFVGPNTDLHITNIALNATGDSTAVVADDIDLDVRPSIGSTRPDIGADEIVVVNNDAIAVGVVQPADGACENATQAVEVEIGNNGLLSISNINVTVNVTGIVTTTLTGNVAGPLASGASTTLNVGNISTTGGGQVCFEIITQLTGDGNPTNDTTNACVNIAPTVPNLVADTACFNQSGTLTASPVGGISWYNVPSGGTPLSTADTFVTPPLFFATTYYAEVTACGTTRYPVTVPVFTPSPVNLGADTTICSSDFVTITAPNNNVMSYMWSNGETTQSVIVQNDDTYQVTVTDNNGCAVTASRDISHFVAPTATGAVDTLACGNAGTGTVDLTVSGGTAPFTFLWDNLATTEDVNGLNSGPVTVTITDANGCPYEETFVIGGPSPIIVDDVDITSASCGANSDGEIDIEVSGGAGGYTFQWNDPNNSTTQDISGLSTGTYTVVITDVDGCSTTETFNFSATATTQITLVATTDESADFAGSATVAASGGQAPYFIVWSNGQTGATADSLVAGTYIVTVYDGSGCAVTDTIVINYTQPNLVENSNAVNNLNVFPNPTKDVVNVQLELAQNAEVRLDVYNVAGQLLQTFTPRNDLIQNYEVDLSGYAGGVYMARLVIGDEEVITTRIILQK